MCSLKTTKKKRDRSKTRVIYDTNAIRQYYYYYNYYFRHKHPQHTHRDEWKYRTFLKRRKSSSLFQSSFPFFVLLRWMNFLIRFHIICWIKATGQATPQFSHIRRQSICQRSFVIVNCCYFLHILCIHNTHTYTYILFSVVSLGQSHTWWYQYLIYVEDIILKIIVRCYILSI